MNAAHGSVCFDAEERPKFWPNAYRATRLATLTQRARNSLNRFRADVRRTGNFRIIRALILSRRLRGRFDGASRLNQPLAIIVEDADGSQSQHLGHGYSGIPTLGIDLLVATPFLLRIVPGAVSTKHEFKNLL